jgi:purine-nucleoside phosphorylase
LHSVGFVEHADRSGDPERAHNGLLRAVSRITIAARLDETVRAVEAALRGTASPRIGVVLGTGLGAFVDRMRNVVSMPWGSLPHMPLPRTSGNPGNLCFGVIDDVPLICLQGRTHLYEGYPAWQVVHGVRVMARLGVRSILLTDSCAAIDPSWPEDTLVAVADHLDLSFRAESFIDLEAGSLAQPPGEVRAPYDAALSAELHGAARSEVALAARIGKPVEIPLHEGVYAGVFDLRAVTPAQVRMAHALGASVIGAGIVPEVQAATELGARVVALAHVAFVAGPRRTPIDDEPTGRHLAPPVFDRVARAWILRADRAER